MLRRSQMHLVDLAGSERYTRSPNPNPDPNPNPNPSPEANPDPILTPPLAVPLYLPLTRYNEACSDGERRKETCNINRSLSALGNVMGALVAGSQG